MPNNLRVVMAQINLLVGDVRGNAQQVIEAAKRARDEFNAQLIVFPELALAGYPPEDLLLRPGMHVYVLAALERIKREVHGIHMVVGHPHHATGGLYNAASVIRDGQIIATAHKQHLPNYSVFDEKRYFTPGTKPCVVDIEDVAFRHHHLRRHLESRAGAAGQGRRCAMYTQHQCLAVSCRQGQ